MWSSTGSFRQVFAAPLSTSRRKLIFVRSHSYLPVAYAYYILWFVPSARGLIIASQQFHTINQYLSPFSKRLTQFAPELFPALICKFWCVCFLEMFSANVCKYLSDSNNYNLADKLSFTLYFIVLFPSRWCSKTVIKHIR